MKVILLKGVPKLGKPEDVVEVSEGYAANALFPRKLAIPATASALAALKQRQDGRMAQKAEQRHLLDTAIADMKNRSIQYRAPANQQGSLFSKIDAADLSAWLLSEYRISIDAAHITLPDGAIKKTGMHEIVIRDGNHEARVPVEVVAK